MPSKISRSKKKKRELPQGKLLFLVMLCTTAASEHHSITPGCCTYMYQITLQAPYGSRVSLTGEEEERKKENDDFRFFQNSFSRLL